MDSTEQAAQDFLTHLQRGSVVYEPDGNIPPDFAVGGTIAVEVRRLNQHHAGVGLEVVDIPLLQSLRKLVADLGPPVHGHTWGIFYRFSRPLEPLKTLRPKIKDALRSYTTSVAPKRQFISVAPSFSMTVFKYPVLKATQFFVMGDADENSGGSLISLMESNISHCVAEKSAKIAKCHARYAKWWLVLVDHIGFGFDSLGRDLFLTQVSVPHAWDRVVVISHKDPTLFIDVPQ
jgi:hypothetical protein